jgi:AraC family transcriptional regulator
VPPLIYREMPPVWDPSFRTVFYESWGRENAAISARARRVEYAEYEQLLSIKAAFGGAEEYFIDGRRVAVDDDTFLILNAGRCYASRIHSQTPVESFSIFFRSRLAQEVFTATQRSTSSALNDPEFETQLPVEFDERLREHDRTVTPALLHIKQQLDTGIHDQLWLDEQLHELLGLILQAEHRNRLEIESIPSAKRATRRELHRRLGLATTYVHTHFRNAIGLRDIARAAHLSPYHFLRLFKAVYGITPSTLLNRKRTAEALRLISRAEMSMAEIAANVGFGSRTSLFRHLKVRHLESASLERR